MQTIAKDNTQRSVKDKLKDFGVITLGTLLVAVGVYFFKFPNNFSTGGVSGLSILLGQCFPQLTPGTFVLIFNMLLLVLGFCVFGRDFGLKTTYSTILMSLVIRLLEIVWPMTKPFTSEPILELCFAIFLPALGSALLFNLGASTGGTDVVAKILKKFTRINIGRALFLSDFLIVAATFVVFGSETGLFAFAGLLAKSLLVDVIIDNINIKKYFHIVTTEPDVICEYIHQTLKHGATVSDAEGSFTHEKKKMIFTVISRDQAVQLRSFVHQVDPHAFMMITSSSEIIGKGFRNTI